jgi:hypothetical protein
MNKFQFTFLTRLFFTGAVLTGVSIAFLTASQAYSNRAATNDPLVTIDPKPLAPQSSARIQLAILLDTSNSMDGLINQTREQLWQMVDELSSAKRNGLTPQLQVAVFEYGNDGLPSSTGHVRKVVGLTSELDRVSEALFSLTTNGGEEFCGYAIDSAIKQLDWSGNADDLRMIFIAGNEPFTQGPISYVEAINLAKQHDITISTIFAGNHQEGLSTGWQQGAVLAGGNFMSIDHNQQVAHIEAPQDKKIVDLNRALNDTYIPFGAKGQESVERQRTQDVKSAEVSDAYLAKRAKAKASAVYNNTQWDLVDAMASGTVDLDKLEKDQLPEPMQAMTKAEQQKFIAEKKTQRDALQEEILKISEEREQYIADQQQQLNQPAAPTFNDAIKEAISQQAEKKDYVFAK